ncbi:hypothetical protein HDV00_008520 [Rhizophlyctis rosea]|nr:hypothetical protein HDV00_008520 [Rhizophlyctis rosea]
MDGSTEAKSTGGARAQQWMKRLHTGDAVAVNIWQEIFSAYKSAMELQFERMGIRLTVETDELKHGLVSETGSLMDEVAAAFGSMADDRVDLSPVKLGAPRLVRSNSTPTPLLVDVASSLSYAQLYLRVIRVAPEDSQYSHAQAETIIKRLKGQDMSVDLQSLFVGTVSDLTSSEGITSLVSIFDRAQTYMLKFAKEEDDGASTDNQGEQSMYLTPSATADRIGVTAVTWQILQGKRVKPMRFEWKRVMSDVKDPAVFVTYTYARLCGWVMPASLWVREIKVLNFGLSYQHPSQPFRTSFCSW